MKEAISRGIIAGLYQAGGELQAQTIRSSRADTGQTKGSYQYRVQEGSRESTVYIGSNLENAIWEEFGTGEYALKGDGRKGGWYIPESELSPKAKSKMRKVIGKDGKVYYFTRGKRPNRPMFKAFNFFAWKDSRHNCKCNQEKFLEGGTDEAFRQVDHQSEKGMCNY